MSEHIFKHAFLVSVATLKATAPPEWVKLQEDRAAINNLPCIGHDSNVGYLSQVQLNLAGVEKDDSSNGLDKNLGKAGCPHYDAHDCPQGYTCMFACSNFDKYNVHPGFFFFLEMGLFVKMVNFTLVFFSGLHFHGGSPPRAAPGENVPADASRVVVVHYPNDPLLNGTVPTVLGLSGSGSRVEILPSARYDPHVTDVLQRGPLNFMRDGDAVMSRDAYLTYIPRQIASLLETLVSQSPHLDLNFSALKDLFLDKSNGQVIDYSSTWKYPPGMSDEAREEMRSISQQIETDKLRFCLSVPTQARRLYNDSKLKVQKDAVGHKVLVVQLEKVYAARKKRKGEYNAIITVVCY